MAKPQRSISYISIPLSDFPNEQVVSWGKNNADLFRTLALSQVTITSSEADAKKILQQVKDNKLSFEDAAKSHSQDSYADKGGDAGNLVYYSFSQNFADSAAASTIASLAKGDISEVYSIGEGAWAFFKINSDPTPPDFALTKTLEEVRAYLEQKEKGILESWAIAKANGMISSPDLASFEKTASSLGYKLKSAGPFIINLGNPTFYAYNQQIPLLQAPYPLGSEDLVAAESDESFMTELFSLPKGKVSKPIIVDDTVVVFGITDDKDATDDDTALVKFGYPYFHQQTVETQTRNAFLKSKKFKDEFSTMFFKIFQTGSSTSK
jgi:hypothetical protein